MRTYRIDKARINGFAAGRQIFQWIMLAILVLIFIKSFFDYETSDKTNANLIFHWLLTILMGAFLIYYYLLLKKYNHVIGLFFAWDRETVVTIDEEKMQVTDKESSLIFNLRELTVDNYAFLFYGGRLNPFNGLGYAKVIAPGGQSILMSSILFDLGYGVDKIAALFETRVKKYSKRRLSFFATLPPNKYISNDTNMLH